MKNFKELLMRRKFITFILSLFITISGLLFFLCGLIMLDVPALAEFTIIFSIILMFTGYMIPKAIIKLENDKYSRLQQEHNEITYTIKKLQYIKIANDNEKQNFILRRKLVIGTVIFYINKNKTKKYIQKIMNNKIYVADCYSYDKKIERVKNHTFYCIKITDGNYFMNKWFVISPKLYINSNIEVKLYLSDEIDIYDIITNDNSKSFV